jgi:hypothetical protein
MEDVRRTMLIKGEGAVQTANAGRSTHIERSLVVANHCLVCFIQRLAPNIFNYSLLISNYSLALASGSLLHPATLAKHLQLLITNF